MPAEKGIIRTVLGNGSEGWDGDGGPAIAAACQTPYACEFDPQATWSCAWGGTIGSAAWMRTRA